MNDYISSGLDKDLVDPDGGVNAEKNEAELGLLSKNKDNVPLEFKQFPDKGFEVGLSRIPTIGYSQIWKYLIEDVELKRQLSVEKQKKVVSKEGEDLAETMCRLSIYKRDGDGISINKNHKYFYQVQQQLFCTNLEACHFIVCNGDEMHTDIIVFDATFWGDILCQLEVFYFQHVFPELVYPRLKFGGLRWNSNEIEFPRME